MPKGRVFGHTPCFGLKMGIDSSFSSGIGYGFQGNCGSVQTYFLNLLFQFQMSEKEREKLYANSKWILRKYFFVAVLV